MLNVAIGLTLGAVLELNLNTILRLFGASDHTLPHARAYMQILLFGNAFTHLYYGLNAQLRSTSRPMYAMYANIGTVAINTVLAYLFVIHLRWGITGAAWSTLIAQVCALCWQFWLFSGKNSPVRLMRRYLRPQWRVIERGAHHWSSAVSHQHFNEFGGDYPHALHGRVWRRHGGRSLWHSEPTGDVYGFCGDGARPRYAADCGI